MYEVVFLIAGEYAVFRGVRYVRTYRTRAEALASANRLNMLAAMRGAK
jgi:hypothetical protein